MLKIVFISSGPTTKTNINIRTPVSILGLLWGLEELTNIGRDKSRVRPSRRILVFFI